MSIKGIKEEVRSFLDKMFENNDATEVMAGIFTYHGHFRSSFVHQNSS